MPPKFKGLATIVAWTLFVFGLLRLLIGLVYAFSSGPAAPPTHAYYDFAVGVGSLILSVVAMKLRKALE